MKLKQLFTDDSAVSPVIGVILMVAITVILAAVIGTFVLNLGGSVSQTTPQASFGFDFSDDVTGGDNTEYDNVTITHETGASISASQLNVTGPSEFGYSSSGSYAGDGASSISFTDMGVTGSVSAGTSITISKQDGDFNGETLRVVWNAENDENSATLSDWTAPSN